VHSISSRTYLTCPKIDTVITSDLEALQWTEKDYFANDIIIIGSNNRFGSRLLSSRPGLVKVSPYNFTVGDRTFIDPSQGNLSAFL
jgi:hypothetical protein